MADIDKLFNRLDLLLDRIEKIVPGQVDKAELLHLERQQRLG